MKLQIIKHNQDISELEKQVFENGLLKPMPKEFYDGVDSDHIKLLMLKHGIYVLPTTELIEWLRNNITGSAIEIGSGLGTIGRSLGIPCTDNYRLIHGLISSDYVWAFLHTTQGQHSKH